MRLGAQPFLWKWILFAWEWKMTSIPSFWNRGPEELRNGLLVRALLDTGFHAVDSGFQVLELNRISVTSATRRFPRKISTSGIKKWQITGTPRQSRVYYGDGTTKDKVNIDLTAEKGSSAWLTVPPLRHLGLHLNEREFSDAVKIRYDWPVDDISSTCVWGKFYRRPLSDLKNRIKVLLQSATTS